MSSADRVALGLTRRGGPSALFILLALAATSCGRGETPESRALLELADDTIQLERGVTLTNVLVSSAATGTAAFAPETIRLRPGDVVRFITADRHPHAIAFDAAQLAPATAAFLERTGQLRSPPLITEGASWIVSFADAPPGFYPFLDLSQDRRGAIIVQAAEEE